MTRRELREEIFKLLFMVEFYSKDEMKEQVKSYFEDFPEKEISEKDHAYIEEKYETDTRGEHSGRCCKKFDNYDLKFSTEENGFIVLANYGRFRGSRAANVEVHGGASLEEVVVPVIELTLADSSMQVALSDKNIVSDYKDGASILLYVNKPIKQVISLVVEGERYFGEKVDENHYRINVANMKRAKTYSADVYVGESLITRIDVTTKGKSASVNSDFDDLF